MFLHRLAAVYWRRAFSPIISCIVWARACQGCPGFLSLSLPRRFSESGTITNQKISSSAADQSLPPMMEDKRMNGCVDLSRYFEEDSEKRTCEPGKECKKLQRMREAAVREGKEEGKSWVR